MSRNSQINQDDLVYYFDGLQRDRLDRGPAFQKSADLHAIREKLLNLPDDLFNPTVKTIQNLIGSYLTQNRSPDPRQRAELSEQLFTNLPKPFKQNLT